MRSKRELKKIAKKILEYEQNELPSPQSDSELEKYIISCNSELEKYIISCNLNLEEIIEIDNMILSTFLHD